MEKYSIIGCNTPYIVNKDWFTKQKDQKVLFMISFQGCMVGMTILINTITWENKFFFKFTGKFIPDDGSDDQRVWNGVYNLDKKEGFVKTDQKL
jgi:hypothetical protein